MKIFPSHSPLMNSPLYAILDMEEVTRRGITPRDFAQGFFSGGGKNIQYRDKISDLKTVQKNAEDLAGFARDSGGCFVLNDFVEVAESLGVCVHVGQDTTLMEDLKIPFGRSTHDPEEIRKVAKEKPAPAYIGFGAMFPSETKPGIVPAQKYFPDLIKTWPGEVVLIGGITLENVRQIPTSRKWHYAVIRDFFRYGNHPADIERYTKEFLKLVD